MLPIWASSSPNPLLDSAIRYIQLRETLLSYLREPAIPPDHDNSSQDALVEEIAQLKTRVQALETERTAAQQLIHGTPHPGSPPILELIPAVIWTTDQDLVLTWWTGGGIRAIGLQSSDLIGVSIYTYLGTRDPDNPSINAHQRALQGEEASIETTLHGTTLAGSVRPHHNENGDVIGVVGAALDITERIQGEEDRARLLDELRASFERVKTLSGLIPICMHCKNVRNDGGFWEEVESFVRQNSDAQFSHSICPECIGDAMSEARQSPSTPSKPRREPT